MPELPILGAIRVYSTEKFGSNTGVQNGDTIPHGLSGTPDIVILTVEDNITTWIKAITATTFTVGLPAGSYNPYWYATYKP
jgi:hypothetical protein